MLKNTNPNLLLSLHHGIPGSCKRNVRKYSVAYTMTEVVDPPRKHLQFIEAMDRIIVPCRANRDSFAAAGLPTEQIRVLPTGIDIKRYEPRRGPDLPPWQRPKNKLRFLCIGQYSGRKGYDLLLSAWDKAGLSEAELFIMPGASFAPICLKAVEALPASTQMSITVWDKPVPYDYMARVYHAAHAFVLPTRGEGECLPFLEAMASGLPVIGPQGGAMADYIDEEHAYPIRVDGLMDAAAIRNAGMWHGTYNGRLFLDVSEESLVEQFIAVATDYEEARQRGLRARRWVEEHRDAAFCCHLIWLSLCEVVYGSELVPEEKARELVDAIQYQAISSNDSRKRGRPDCAEPRSGVLISGRNHSGGGADRTLRRGQPGWPGQRALR